MNMFLSIQHLGKIYGARGGDSLGVSAMNSVSFEVKRGDVFTLLGPSGCGKTTTLQCIAGLEKPTSGRIVMEEEVVFDAAANTLVPANKRKLGMVFQSYAIWPHMTVFENVAFPLLYGGTKIASDQVRRRVMRTLDLVKLHDFADRPSPHLSGGQQQRVALARALVHEPRLLLLDEPLSNLDAKLRDMMRVELRQLVKSLGITTIFVTHDQIEALSMSDQIILMQGGRIVQHGAPRDIYLSPKSRFAAEFMGRSNVLPARTVLGSERLETPIGLLRPSHACANQRINVVIRPQAIRVALGSDKPNEVENCFAARIVGLQFLGDVVEGDLEINGYPLKAMLDPYVSFSIGQEVWAYLAPERCVVVADDDVAAAATSVGRPVVEVR